MIYADAGVTINASMFTGHVLALFATALFAIAIDKSVNDIHGLAMGDDVIELVVRRLMAVLGRDVSIARSGGEEFTVATTVSELHMSALAERVGRAPAIADDPKSFGDSLHNRARVAAELGHQRKALFGSFHN